MRNWNRIGARGAWLVFALALALQLLGGCDVAVAGYLASRSGGKHSSSGGVVAPDTTYKIYVRQLGPAPLDLDTEDGILEAAGGVPSGAWVFVASGTGSQTLDIAAVVGGPFNSILITAPEAEDYRVDALERIDANGVSVGSAAAADIRSDEVTNESEAAGVPDGKTANTNSLPGAQAYLFVRFGTSLDLLRITLAGATRAAGDVEFAFTESRLANQLSGGVAVAATGQTYLPFVDEASRNVLITRISSDGTTSSTISIEVSTNVTGGLPCALIDQGRDRLYVSFVRSSVGSEENLRVSRLTLSSFDGLTTFTEAPVVGVERVEPNALCVNSIGEFLVCGGRPGTIGGIAHWLRKLNVADVEAWSTPTPASGTGNYFHGVATDSSANVFAVGDTNTAGGDWYIQRFTSAGSPLPVSPITEGDTGVDQAVTAAVGGASLYVGGYFTRAGEGRNGLVFKYNAVDLTSDAGGGFPIEINGFDDANDEIMDIAFDGGELFVVGYTTVNSPAQGENWFVRKYTAAGVLVWDRTYHHGFGNDRAVSVVVNGTYIIVSGEVTISGGTTDLHVRKYAR
jgi:hypothetical protein